MDSSPPIHSFSRALTPQQKAEFISFLVGAGALQFGDFTTKSGRKTPYFVNTGKFDDGQKIATLGSWYAKAIAAMDVKMDVKIETIFGPAYKGIPLAVATAVALARELNYPVGYTFNRKEAKTHGDGAHGDGGLFVGYPLKAGAKVALVGDVITAGTTMREVLPVLKKLGVTVVAVFVAVDRMERGQEVSGDAKPVSAIEQVAAEFSVEIRPLITLLDIIDFVRVSPDFKNSLPAIEQYRAQYGI